MKRARSCADDYVLLPPVDADDVQFLNECLNDNGKRLREIMAETNTGQLHPGYDYELVTCREMNLRSDERVVVVPTFLMPRVFFEVFLGVNRKQDLYAIDAIRLDFSKMINRDVSDGTTTMVPTIAKFNTRITLASSTLPVSMVWLVPSID
jgi:hypothetical protein